MTGAAKQAGAVKLFVDGNGLAALGATAMQRPDGVSSGRRESLIFAEAGFGFRQAAGVAGFPAGEALGRDTLALVRAQGGTSPYQGFDRWRDGLSPFVSFVCFCSDSTFQNSAFSLCLSGGLRLRDLPGERLADALVRQSGEENTKLDASAQSIYLARHKTILG
jgi:hypothetical protein